jgi:DNA-binding protein HU-beta
MTKAELVAKIAKDAELTQKQARKVLNSFTEATTAALKAGDTVTLVGFGTFRTLNRAARTGRNPQTGEEIKIAAKTYGKFKPGKALKDMIPQPVEETPKARVKAKVEVASSLVHGKLDVGKRIGSLVGRLKRK